LGGTLTSQRGKPMNQIKLLIVVGVIWLSISFLIISLFLPAFYTADGGVFVGFNVLLIGWLGIFYSLGGLGWYANPLLLMAWLGLALSKLRKAFHIGLGALVLSIAIALCSLLIIHKSIPINEGGGTSEVVSIGIGFYVWLASFVICIFGYIATILFDNINSNGNSLGKS
jgi:hypothetical protein